MKFSFIITPKADKDIVAAIDWYDKHSTETTDRFLDEINLYLAKLSGNPAQGKKVNAKVRRIYLKVFPYAFFFLTKADKVVILRVRHNKQKPLKRYA